MVSVAVVCVRRSGRTYKDESDLGDSTVGDATGREVELIGQN